MLAQKTNSRTFRRAIVCSLLVGIVLPPIGCSPTEQQRRHVTATAVTTTATQGQLLRAMDYLNRLSEYDREQALGQAAYHLNHWLDEQKPDPHWEVDPLTARLPREIRDSDLLDNIGSWTFVIADVRAMQEATLLRDLSTWVSKQPADARLKIWLDGQADSLDDLQRENLAIAERLFDWTVRNIQLQSTPPYPDESVAPSAGGEQSREKRIPPPQRAIPGPGYRFPPWEILQYGYGDALQRSRIFIELARQQGIDVVYLALPGNTVPPRPRPWLTAAFIGGELYLFDCELGLPIPGPNSDGIATLAQVLDSPELIAALEADGQTYRFAHDELKELLALLDISPANLSQRMQFVQSHLAGDERTILAVAPTQLAERVKGVRGISNAVLWSVPFETIWFQAAMNKLLETNREVASSYYQTVGIFQTRGPLTQGRQLHLQGKFERQEEGQEGAKGLYMQARIPNANINQIGTNEEAQKAMGLVRGTSEGEFVWRSRLAGSHLLATQAKQHSTYWLALSHYETGNYEAATTWLQKRTIDATPNGTWTAGALYNLGRTYEALGKYDEARQLYSEDESPQAHGNHLRAKLLKQWANSE
ncbi:MAG: CDC27 family protein [Planctomycetota bacterium]|nr:CDC27 family protein [Planctomycetota bacterium]